MQRLLNGPSLQTIRHELRTPVNHIVGYGEMLLDDLAGAPRPERFEPLREVVAAGQAILALIDDSLAGADGAAREEGLAALHGRLRPHLRLIARRCDELEQVVEREGPAAAAPDLAKIAVAAATLGELAAALHAPALADPPRAAPLGPAGAPLVAQEGSLLLVDDNALNRDMLSRRLERMGFQVEQAEDGQRALARIGERPFDLVLLDLMMPVLDGYGVLAHMQASPEIERIPVIVLSALDDIASIVRAIELGADDYLPKPVDPVLLQARIGACLFKKRMRDSEASYLRRIEDERRRADELLNVVIPIGVALSGEKDFNRLLERIVVEAQELCNADGGTLYLRTDDQRLRFVIVRNRSLDIAMGGASGKDIPFPPLRLYDEASGAPLFNYVVTHAALEGTTINIADAYHADGYDFSGTRDFDARTGYRSTSILNIPLRAGQDQVIGVLQLINAMDDAGNVIPFDAVAEQMLSSLGTLAAAALGAYAREQQLRQEIADLRIEIDQSKKQREVERITSTPYFAQIQEKARQLRAANAAPHLHEEDADAAMPPAARRTASAGPERVVFEVDGQQIVARVQGQANRRLMLLIHGWSSSWYALSPLLPALSERYRCVAVDLPGYGESPRLAGRASIQRYADLLAGLIRQLSPDHPALLVGHSMGGMTSVTMALSHPALIERLVLICPTISGKLSFWINTFISPITLLERSRIAGRIVAALEPYMLSMTDRLMRPASFAERTKIAQADYERLRADARRPGQGRVRAECFWAMRDNDLRGKLGAVDIPSLVIWGMEDNTVPLRDASTVADEWPQAELRVLPKAGHWPQFETPEVTRRHIRSFLATPIKLLRSEFKLRGEG